MRIGSGSARAADRRRALRDAAGLAEAARPAKLAEGGNGPPAELARAHSQAAHCTSRLSSGLDCCVITLQCTVNVTQPLLVSFCVVELREKRGEDHHSQVGAILFICGGAFLVVVGASNCAGVWFKSRILLTLVFYSLDDCSFSMNTRKYISTHYKHVFHTTCRIWCSRRLWSSRSWRCSQWHSFYASMYACSFSSVRALRV